MLKPRSLVPWEEGALGFLIITRTQLTDRGFNILIAPGVFVI